MCVCVARNHRILTTSEYYATVGEVAPTIVYIDRLSGV